MRPKGKQPYLLMKVQRLLLRAALKRQREGKGERERERERYTIYIYREREREGKREGNREIKR